MKMSKFNLVWLTSLGMILFERVLGNDVATLGFAVFAVCTLWFLFNLALTPFAKKFLKKDIDNFLKIKLSSEEIAQEYIRSFLGGAKVVISPDEEDEIIAKAKQQDGSYSKYEILRRMMYYLEKENPGSQKRLFRMMNISSITEMKERLEEIEKEGLGIDSNF